MRSSRTGPPAQIRSHLHFELTARWIYAINHSACYRGEQDNEQDQHKNRKLALF